ncbi:MAG: hypothetical protein IGQ45_13215 [Cyanobacterium sp. T60_A2020_053]|nr:hypothetical protein [Cyanobacterium sp. T60_A2020_053]
MTQLSAREITLGYQQTEIIKNLTLEILRRFICGRKNMIAIMLIHGLVV